MIRIICDLDGAPPRGAVSAGLAAPPVIRAVARLAAAIDFSARKFYEPPLSAE
jgi:hypothetical protein